MKKVIIAAFLIALTTVGAIAQKADIFTFSIGSGAGYNVTNEEISSETQFGMNYVFNDAFSGGFSFRNITGVDVNLMNITVIPAEKVSLSLYTGAIPTVTPAFGVGFSFDLFAKKAGLFTKLSVYADWLGSSDDASAFSVSDGGIILFGLKTQVGL